MCVVRTTTRVVVPCVCSRGKWREPERAVRVVRRKSRAPGLATRRRRGGSRPRARRAGSTPTPPESRAASRSSHSSDASDSHSSEARERRDDAPRVRVASFRDRTNARDERRDATLTTRAPFLRLGFFFARAFGARDVVEISAATTLSSSRTRALSAFDSRASCVPSSSRESRESCGSSRVFETDAVTPPRDSRSLALHDASSSSRRTACSARAAASCVLSALISECAVARIASEARAASAARSAASAVSARRVAASRSARARPSSLDGATDGAASASVSSVSFLTSSGFFFSGRVSGYALADAVVRRATTRVAPSVTATSVDTASFSAEMTERTTFVEPSMRRTRARTVSVRGDGDASTADSSAASRCRRASSARFAACSSRSAITSRSSRCASSYLARHASRSCSTDRVFAPSDLSAARTTSDDRAEAGNWPVSVCACRGWSPKRFANAYASWNRP